MNAKLLGSALNLSGFAQIYLVNRYTRAIISKMEIGVGLQYLSEAAGLGFLIRAPAQELCAVTKATAGKMIILDFNYQLCPQRLPFARLLRAPATWSARFVSGESRRRNQRLKLFGQFFLFSFIEARGV